MKTITVDGIKIPVSKLEELGYVKADTVESKSPNKRWMPNDGDKYYTYMVGFNNPIIVYTWTDGELDRSRHAYNNVFKTKELAEKARDQRLAQIRVLDRLRELEGDFIADWNDKYQNKYIISYSHHPDLSTAPFSIHHCSTLQYAPNEWCSTKEAWQQVIYEMEDDVKLMMGIA